MKIVRAIFILMLSFVLFVGNTYAQQEQQKPNTQKVESKNGNTTVSDNNSKSNKSNNINNCPVACKKNCTINPQTCKKALRALEKQENNANNNDTNGNSKNSKNNNSKNKKK